MGAAKSSFDELDNGNAGNTELDAETEFKETSTSRKGAVLLHLGIASVPLVVCGALAWLLRGVSSAACVLVILGILLAAVLFLSTRVVLEWERAVVLRLGRFHKVAGPGLVFIRPLCDSITSVVDMRMRSTAFKAEHVLTADLVPVNVDAVLFWTVWDAEKACVEVKSYERLVFWVAQTTLRDVMGAVGIAQLSTRRTQIDAEVQSILETKTNEWGITVTAVEIRDIEVPDDLQEALSAEARAEQERSARMILAEVEKDISELYVDAAETYGDKDAALQLRAMSAVSESVKERGGMVVIPSALSEAFDGLRKFVD